MMRCLCDPLDLTLALAKRIASAHIKSPRASPTLRSPINLPLKSTPAPWKRNGSLAAALLVPLLTKKIKKILKFFKKLRP